MQTLPTGTVTFLMTDVEGSTRFWDERPAEMRAATIRLDEAISGIVASHDGHLIKSRGEGDSHFAVFARPTCAVCAALQLQRAAEDLPFRIRIAVHTGETEQIDDDYYGPTVNRCARIRAIAHGGQILLSQSTTKIIESEVPEGTCLKDHGLHRLKDLMRPEWVSEVVDLSRPVHTLPPRSMDQVPNNLPIQLTSFIGRETQIRQVTELLQQQRMITISGAGGSGKTRLALQVAAENLDAYPDGVWFIDLTHIQDPLLIPKAFADAAHIGVTGREPTTVFLQSMKEASALLVVDNCEHLLGHAAGLIGSILRSCSKICVLATSREALKISGEHLFLIPPLAIPPADVPMTADEVAKVEAPRLFLERAASRAPRFRITEANKDAVVTLCRRLDGIPLAIEHVAANVSILSPQQILDRWKEGFPVLATDRRDGIERHNSLRASIDWSYEMLSHEERALFTRLAAFDGPWSLESCEAVCAGDGLDSKDILPVLQSLVDKCLVVTDEDEEGNRFFTFLVTMRAYAAEKLGEARDELELKLVEWYASHLERLGALPPSELVGAFGSLEREYPNVKRALGTMYSVCHRDFLATCLNLRQFWLRRGYYSEGMHWLERALAAPCEAGPADAADAFNVLGALAYKRQMIDESRTYYEQALALFDELGNRQKAAAAMHNLAILESDAGHTARALDWFERAVERLRELGSSEHLPHAMLNLAVTYLDVHKPEACVRIVTEVLAMLEDDHWLAGIAQMNLAEAYVTVGDCHAALEAYKACFGQWRRSPDRSHLGEAFDSLGCCAAKNELWEEAARLAGAAESAWKTAGSAPTPRQEPSHRKLMADCVEKLGRAKAQEQLKRGRAISRTAAIEEAIRTCEHLTKALAKT